MPVSPPNRCAGDPEEPAYIAEADCVMQFLDDVPCRAVRLGEHVMAYVLSDDPSRIVGCQIEDVVKRLGRCGILTLGDLLSRSGVPTDGPGLCRVMHQSPLAAQRVQVPGAAPAPNSP